MVHDSTNGQGVGVGIDQSGGSDTIYGERESTLENFSGAASKASKKLAEMSKYLTEQEVILKKVRKQWKMLTGGIVGAFYSIAKLSPLFASYISEFGGVLGYVYDTAIIPWGDAIEGLLDVMWGFADAFDDSNEGVQKWTGFLLMGVPIAAGLLLTLTGLGEILVWMAGTHFIKWLVKAAKAFVSLLKAAAPIVAIFLAFYAVLALFYSGAKGIAEWMSDTSASIWVLIVAVVKIIAGLGIWIAILKIVAAAIIGVTAPAWAWIVVIVAAIAVVVKFVHKLGLLDGVIRRVKSAWSGFKTWAGFGDTNVNVLGSNATGATIVQTGIYQLHQGETVIPATRSGSVSGSTNIITISPQISIAGGISSSMDVRRIADDLSRYWMADIQKIVGSGHR